MVAVVERDEDVLLGPANATPVRERQLQPDLDGGRSRVGVEDLPEARRRQLDQPLRELERRDVRHPEKRRVRDPLELGGERLVQLGPVVPVDVHPEGRVAVVVLDPVRIDELDALAALDHDRLVREVVLHLGERVPEEPPVLLQQLRVGGTRGPRKRHGW